MFDLRSVRYFVVVAEELHFGRAAERLHMSQPPLSQAIKKLEREVGARLFERSNRKVVLTPAGDAFLAACRPLLEQAAEVADVPRLAANGQRARLSVGAVASALSWPLPQALAQFQAQMPGTAISIHEIDTDEVVSRLSEGSIDVALARLAASRAAIRTHVLLREAFVAIAPATHRIAAETSPIALAGLTDESWVWITREVSPDYHDEMASAFRNGGFTPRKHHTARSIASQIAIVASGAGISIIPISQARNLPARVIARPILSPAKTVTLAVTTREHPTSHETALRRCIEDAVTSEADAKPS